MNNKKRAGIRTALILALALILVLCAIAGFISLKYKGYVRRHVDVWVSKASDGLYHASIRNISINPFTRSLTITGIRLAYHKENGSVHKTTVTLFVPKVELNSIACLTLLFKKELTCGQVYIWHPEVLLISRPHVVDSSRIVFENEAPAIKKIFAAAIHIVDPNITFVAYSKTGDSTISILKGGTAILQDWLLEPSKKDSTRFLLARSCNIDSASFTTIVPAKLYKINTPSFSLSSDQNSLLIRNLALNPTVNKETFYRIIGHQQTIWSMNIPSVSFEDVNWSKLLHKGELCSTEIINNSPVIKLYYSYLAPPDPSNKIKFDPIRLLANSPLKINIKRVTVNNADINYTELNDQSRMAGTLVVNKLTAKAQNIVNTDSMIAINKTCSIYASGILQHKSRATASMRLTLSDSLGAFTIKGSLTDLDAIQISDLAESLNLMKVDSLHLGNFSVTVHGNQNFTHEEQTILYDNLKIELEKRKDGSLKNKPIPTFVANAFFCLSIQSCTRQNATLRNHRYAQRYPKSIHIYDR